MLYDDLDSVGRYSRVDLKCERCGLSDIRVRPFGAKPHFDIVGQSRYSCDALHNLLRLPLPEVVGHLASQSDHATLRSNTNVACVNARVPLKFPLDITMQLVVSFHIHLLLHSCATFRTRGNAVFLDAMHSSQLNQVRRSGYAACA